jgi:DNA-binding PadR family transcriptional regulator
VSQKLTPKLPATSYAVLGMLSLHHVSGYELTQTVENTIAHFWTISKSQVYGELARLEELGLVVGTDVSQERLPDKRIYELTAEGGRVLDDWLEQPTHERSKLRSGPLLKLFFAHRLQPDAFDALLDRYAENARRARDELGAIVEALKDEPSWFYQSATALIGLRNAESVLGAIDEIRATQPQKGRER